MYLNKINELEEKIESKIEKNIPLSSFTTFKVGGMAEFYIAPRKAEEVKEIINFCILESIPFFIMGNGSNLLIADDGVLGITIHTKNLNEIEIDRKNREITCGAGTSLGELAIQAYKAGFKGLEFASGIPGSVGGGIFMNAGAYGGSLSDVYKEGLVLTKYLVFENWNREKMNFSYRKSQLKTDFSYLLEATFQLEKGKKEEIMETMKDLNQRRKDKQPLEYPSAGSTFKRPVGFFAGKLIMEADFAGYTVGDAMVSKKHCGFIINKGSACSKDIIYLMSEIKEKILKTKNVGLEPEIEFIGNFTKEEREKIRFLRGY